MNFYEVKYIDDLCYCYTSYFFTLDAAKRWCKLYKRQWMKWHIYDKDGHEKYGGCNNISYCGT